jgi:hypothetical protein
MHHRYIWGDLMYMSYVPILCISIIVRILLHHLTCTYAVASDYLPSITASHWSCERSIDEYYEGSIEDLLKGVFVALAGAKTNEC